MTDLNWNDTHTINSQHKYCYCRTDRNLLDVTLQCKKCRDWFHATCTSIEDPPALLFTINYTFTCRSCHPEGIESFERTTAGWKDICATAMANLVLEEIEYKLGDVNKSIFDSKNSSLMKGWRTDQYYFNKKQIIPYVDEHWKDICTERQRTPTWWATLGSCLYSSKDIFTASTEQHRSAAADFVLTDPNLWHIRPLYPTTTHKRKLEDISQQQQQQQQSATAPAPATATATATAPAPASSSTRRPSSSSSSSAVSAPQNPRVEQWVVSNTPSPKSSSPAVTPIITPAMFSSSNSTDHPFNRFGFKYIPCEKSQVLPHLAYQQTDTGNENGCVLSLTDKSSYVSVANDGLTITTDRGFRMCRANLGVKEGTWFWEATILKGNDDTGGHVRIGWARREACLNAPVGYDGYSYGIRDKTGEKVFCSRPQTYGTPFETGDVIGLSITLPPRHHTKSATRKRIPIAFKDTLWFEEKDYRQSKEMEALADRYRNDSLYQPRTLPDSSITLYKNGVCLGVMYQDLTDYEDFGSLPEMILTSQQQKKKRKHNSAKKDDPMATSTPRMRMIDDEDFDGNAKHQQWNDEPPVADDGSLGYYPAVSVFKGGVVSCNFGPDFQFPPPPGDWKPMAARHADYMVEECMWDLVDEVARSFRKKVVTE